MQNQEDKAVSQTCANKHLPRAQGIHKEREVVIGFLDQKWFEISSSHLSCSVWWSWQGTVAFSKCSLHGLLITKKKSKAIKRKERKEKEGREEGEGTGGEGGE